MQAQNSEKSKKSLPWPLARDPPTGKSPEKSLFGTFPRFFPDPRRVPAPVPGGFFRHFRGLGSGGV